jgi:rod shape-determining protein MreD
MMRRTSLWLLALLVLVLHLTLFRRIGVWGIRPASAVIVTVYVALGLGPVGGSLFGFLVGLAQLSILSGSAVSLPLAGTLIGFLVGKYGTKIMHESYLVQMVILFLSVLIYDAVNLTIGVPGGFLAGFLRFSVGTALYTALAGILIAAVIERIAGFRLVA